MKTINNIVEQLEAELNALGYINLTTCKDYKKALKLIKVALQELKELIIENSFSSIEEEIIFFKEIKPQLYSKFLLISFIIEYNNYKVMSERAEQEFIKRNKTKFIYFQKEYKTYILQLLDCTSEQEKIYFVRKKFSPPLNKVFSHVMLNPKFSTFHSEIQARFQAQKLIENHLKSRNKEKEAPVFKKYQLNWTQNKTALIELIYGLYFSNSLNNGQCKINEIKEVFEAVFNVDLGNVYRTFHEIKNREERISFIETLRITMENKLDEDDSFSP